MAESASAAGGPWEQEEHSQEPEEQAQGQQEQGQQQKLFTCSHKDCTKSYARVEHLARHSVSHAQHKAFTCEFCSKSFARRDVLVRHQRSHSSPKLIDRSSDRRTSALQKVKKACLACKAAKSRCDGNSPCAHCISVRKECEYPGTRSEQSNYQSTSSRTSAAPEAALQGSEQQMDVDAVEQNSLHHLSTTSQRSGLLLNSGEDSPAVTTQQHGTINQGFVLPPMPSNVASANNDQNIDPLPSSTVLLGLDSPSLQFRNGSNAGTNSQAALEATQPFATQHLLAGFDFNGLLFGQPTQGPSPISHLTHEPSAYSFDFNNWVTDGDDYLSSFLQAAQNPSPVAVDQSIYPGSSNVWPVPEVPYQSSWAPSAQTVTRGQASSSTQANLPQLLRDDRKTSFAPSGGQQQSGSTLSSFQGPSSAISAPSVSASAEQAAHVTDALLSLTGHVPREEIGSPDRRPVPPLNHGLRTRASSPTLPILTANTEWPTAWDSRWVDDEHSGDIDVGEVLTHQADSTKSIPSMEEVGRLAIMELLRFAEFKIETFHRLYVRFARISVATLDHFLGLYFQHIHPYIPWCHLATFEPSRISGFLLAAMVSLGAQYSDVAGAKQYSHVLGDIVQRAVGEVVTKDNTLNRELQLWQALMLWSFFKSAGVRRLTELTDVFRNSYTVAFDRMYIFGNRNRASDEVLNPNVSLLRRWQLWKTWEGRKRTAFACFLADAEFTVFLNRPNLVMPGELKASLPCSDSIWEAGTEHEWEAAILSQPDFSASKPSACDILDFRTHAKPLISKARSSAFASSVLIQLLHLSMWNLRQSGVFSTQLLKTAYMDIKRALVAVGGGANEFVVGQCLTESRGWTSFAILYHQAFISLRIAPASLLALAGKETPEEADHSRREILRDMQADPTSSREVALHAGQCLRIIRESNHGSPVEVFSLFSSILVLYVFCLATQEQNLDTVEFHQRNDVISLDCPSPSAVEVGWSQSDGLTCSIADFELNTKSAKINVLLHAVSIYKKMKGWGLGIGFARILQSMADRERLFDATLGSMPPHQ